jgi:8-oxo-dGTP diphosphatase
MLGVELMGGAIVQRSAGGVIYQQKEGKMWVALVATKGGVVWGLPKGLVEKGEKPLETALREVYEESGLEGEPVAGLGRIEYWYRDSTTKQLYHKFVHYYLLSYIRGHISEHDWEVDDVAWLPIDDAIEQAHYDNERGILIKAKDEWDKLGREGG